MDRNEFMELVYETFADEPDNVLANGIIEAADAYAEHEKAQLSHESTTSDMVSRQEALDALRECQTYLYDARDPELKIELSSAEAAINNLPPAQPEYKVRFADKDHVWIDGKQYISLPRFQEAVKEAQPKEGHWIEGGIYRDVIECNCSECGQLMTTAATVRMNFCPNCGAYMKGERQK